MISSTRNTDVTQMALLLVAAMMPISANADSGVYIGGSAGGATIEANLDGVTIPGLPSSIDEDDTAFKAFVGYKFDLPVISLGIEGGYVDLGEPDINVLGDELLIDVTGVNLWGLASLDLGLFDVFGKLGYISWDVEADYLGASESDDGSDIGYGLGAAFDIGPLQIRGEYELYDLDDTDVSMLSLGLVYQFN
ncbi:MAG: porin family protein [Woeseiaceae bacterium]